jgi:hypothetical protein
LDEKNYGHLFTCGKKLRAFIFLRKKIIIISGQTLPSVCPEMGLSGSVQALKYYCTSFHFAVRNDFNLNKLNNDFLSELKT